ncbi:MAG: Acyl-CoA synthetase (AMP-forming)/AMP-acid ligase [Panacagrimonas sp.]|nr:non-ribosomal peptide synthetase [Panacagrimonas sp.]MCC2658522.1 Acyl-CoA synthetase (AMP-forming)/AMP-acid ligase [Panacagrimonas sp.]
MPPSIDVSAAARFETLTAALRANRREDRQLILIDGEDDQRALTFVELERRALRLLGALQRRDLRPGDAVILFVNDNERFLEMFWACVLGRLVPVPIAVGISDEHRRKLFRVFGQFDRAWVYSDARTFERVDAFASTHDLGAEHARLRERSLQIGALDLAGAAGVESAAAADDIAFIQYSSGSTREPKGVVLTHRNICANLASIRTAARFTDRDVALSWMPLTHDMGLIGFHLNMLACGVTHAVMRTELFARRPLLWLAKATELRATVLCSPNFGYEHYLKQFESKRPQGLDLSPVRLLFNGAEPISAALCRRFLDVMGPLGLRASAMFPVYGLAEASLAVSFPEPGSALQSTHVDRAELAIGRAVRALAADAPRAVELVRLGRAVPGTDLRIAAEDGAALEAGRLGHVLIRGDNVTRGYFRDEDATRAALPGSEGWLDTGDLGFLSPESGDLVIAGRTKDVIFVNGQNWYPHDLEGLAAEVPGIEINKVVAAGAQVPGRQGGESLVLFVLHRESIEAFVPQARELRRVLGQQAGLEVGYVVPVTRIPKTTSGKLQRHALARAFEQGEFDEAVRALAPLLDPVAGDSGSAAAAAAPGTLECLQGLCARVIPDKRIDPGTNLFEINLSSLTLARLHEAIDETFPGRLDVMDLFDYPTLQDLAGFLDRPAS